MPRALFQLTCINLLLLQLLNVPELHPLDSKPAASNDKKRKRSGVRLYKDTILNNDLRDELHIQMYKYFQWLLAISTDMDATVNGKRCLNDSKISLLEVQSILSTMESTLPVVKSIPWESESSGSAYPLLEDVLQDQLGELQTYVPERQSLP
jgi:hypothetical protein